MKSAKTLMDEGVTGIKLKILVFGPQVASVASDEPTRNLQEKRKQIRRELENLGHHVKYAEDIVDPNLPAPVNNAMLQEIAIMREYDLIVTLVGSPGSIAEATLISIKPDLARKSTLFLDSRHNNGLVAETCRLGEIGGALLHTYIYPEDLTECHLLGYVINRVAEVQTIKFLS